MKIPTKFTFTNGNNNLLKLTNINGDYYCTLPHVEADTISSAVFDRINVEHKLTTGKWKIEEDLSEPEMVFPFTFVVKSSDNPITYTAKGLNTEGRVQVIWEADSEGTDYAKDTVKEFVKEGTWIVQSVGEQEAKEEPAKVEMTGFSVRNEKGELVHGYKVPVDKLVTFNEAKVENFKESTRLSGMAIKLDIANFEESFAKLTIYHEKVELTIKAVEKLSELLESLGIGGCVNVQTFCCESE